MKRRVIISYKCGAPAIVVSDSPWDDIHKEYKDKIVNGLGCDGGGVPGEWCRGCPWEVPPDMEEVTGERIYFMDERG